MGGVEPAVSWAISENAKAIRDLSDEAMKLNAAASPVFAKAGDALQAGVETARVLSVQAGQTARSEQGEHLQTFVNSLRALVEQASAMNEQASGYLAWMREMRDATALLAGSLGNLRKMRVQLQTVMILSRIEEERIASASDGGSQLSQNIEDLANETQTMLDDIAEHAEKILVGLEVTIRRCNVSVMRDGSQQRELRESASTMLMPIIEIICDARTAAAHIRDKYGSFHASTGRVIMALQTEDIARQRNEHVAEACANMADGLLRGLPVDDCAKLLALQVQQLERTQQQVREAAAQMQTTLPALIADIDQLSQVTHDFLESLHAINDQVASMLDGGLQSIGERFAQSSDSLRKSAALVSEQLPKVNRMIHDAETMEDLEDSVQLVSMNATIKTVHLGSQGRALEVVATELHKIAHSGQDDMHELSRQLNALQSSMCKAEEQSERSSKLGVAAIPSAIGDHGASFREWCAYSLQSMTEVQVLSASLQQCLQNGLQAANDVAALNEFYERALHCFSDALAKLGHTRESALAVALQSAASAEYMGLYSMQSERDVHVAVVDGDDAAALDGSGGASEFGDDVELF